VTAVHFPFWATGEPQCGAAAVGATSSDLGEVTCAECRAPFTWQPEQQQQAAPEGPAVRLTAFNPHCEWLGDDD
jgi:hypothetical protein